MLSFVIDGVHAAEKCLMKFETEGPSYPQIVTRAILSIHRKCVSFEWYLKSVLHPSRVSFCLQSTKLIYIQPSYPSR